METPINFYCPTKTLFGKKALAHLPFELTAANAGKPLVLAPFPHVDKKGHRPLIKAFRDSEMTLGLAQIPRDNPRGIQEIQNLIQTHGFDALISLGNPFPVPLNDAIQGIQNPTAPLTWFHIPLGPEGPRDIPPDLVCIAPEMMDLSQKMAPIMDAVFSSLTLCASLVAAGKNPMAAPYATAAIQAIGAHFPQKPKLKSAPLADLTHGCALAGYLSPWMPPVGPGPGAAQFTQWVETMVQNPGPGMGSLLLPLAGPGIHAATPQDQQGSAALEILKKLATQSLAHARQTEGRDHA